MLPEEPLVSVVIPVRNGERLIGRTLASALAQTYRNIEVIVVDDGSTDRTPALVETAAARDRRVRLLRRPHSGVTATRNFGISRANGSLIAPLDADDLWHQEKIARQVAAMQISSPKVGLVYCWCVDIDENDLVIPPVVNKSTAAGSVLTKLVEKGNFLASGSVPLIRRSCFDAVGGYDSDLQAAEDWKLYLALSEICEFAVVPAHLVGYRRSSGSASNNIAVMERDMERVSRWIIDKWPDVHEKVKWRMIYHQNCYLAHLSLTNNRFAKALHYQAKSYRARPMALFAPETFFGFGVRLLARLLRIRRAAPRIPFKDFQPKLQFAESSAIKR
jgi:glycosyltransferase involved in cell wall biosynthesis